ncbi:PHP domain-containing protein [Pirellulaceae bacterium SH467]
MKSYSLWRFAFATASRYALPACLTLVVSVSSCLAQSPAWYKGNLHTHSFWSDGNDFPEMISDWYRTRGYSFLAISDHNVLQSGQRWMKQSTVESRGGKEVIPKYIRRFGESWVETRGESGSESAEIRLKPLDEYRYLLEQSEKFILIPSEEISDKAEGKPVHMNATNVAEAVKPVGGATVREVMENNLRAVLEQEKKLGREIMVHLNHPNFHYGVTFEDLAAVMSEQFFEVYNGHPGVNHRGDKDHPSVERIWDLANHLRVNKLGGSLLLGIATDDSHEYHGKPGSRPGRGWVMVRSHYLTPEHLIRAMESGDFYASSGVSLQDVQWNKATSTLSVAIQSEPNVQYTTEFIVTSKDAELDQIGRVAKTSQDLQSSYTLAPGETIVRAVVTSSIAPVDPVFDDQKQQAWTQPFTIPPPATKQ